MTNVTHFPTGEVWQVWQKYEAHRSVVLFLKTTTLSGYMVGPCRSFLCSKVWFCLWTRSEYKYSFCFFLFSIIRSGLKTSRLRLRWVFCVDSEVFPNFFRRWCFLRKTRAVRVEKPRRWTKAFLFDQLSVRLLLFTSFWSCSENRKLREARRLTFPCALWLQTCAFSNKGLLW